jgi:outer membrane protein assembly factor BamA
LKKKETFTVKFRHINVADSIISKYNSGYFNLHRNSSTRDFLEFEYKLQYNDVDNILYPLNGHTFKLLVKKRGLQLQGGINRFSIAPEFNQYFSHPRQWYSSFRFAGEIKLPFNQPYFNQEALGYKENYLRGQEYFVVDGVAFAFGKFDIKKKIVHFKIPTFLNSKTYNKIPFTIYAKSFADMGYVYNQTHSRLNNRFLYSGGFGLDIVTLYDIKLKVEYSLNQLGQKGLFLHL